LGSRKRLGANADRAPRTLGERCRGGLDRRCSPRASAPLVDRVRTALMAMLPLGPIWNSGIGSTLQRVAASEESARWPLSRP
jgi:hypothetical protein